MLQQGLSKSAVELKISSIKRLQHTFQKRVTFQFNLFYIILQDLLIYGLLALTAHRTRYGAAWSCYERLLCDALHVTIVPWSSTLWAEGGHGLRRARG